MIQDILLLQKREIEEMLLRERYEERDLDARKFSRDLINVILGPRRAGKSTFAAHAVRGLPLWKWLSRSPENSIPP